MSIFDEETKATLIEIFSRLPRKVVDYLVISDVDCSTCNEAEILARELMSLSRNKLEFKIIPRDSNEARKLNPRYVPAFVYGTPKYNVRYYGLPSGQEFPPFIYMHEYIATGKVRLPSTMVDEVKKIKTPLHVKVFVTPECPYCPIVVDTLNQIGLINGNILVETIEAMELPWEADKYNVMYVPAVIVNDIERIDGYASPDMIIELLKNAEKKLREKGVY